MLKTVPKTENIRKRRLQRLFFCPFAESRQHLDHQVLSLFSAGKLVKGGLFQLKPEKTPPNQPRRRGPNFARILYMGYLCVCLSVCFASPASAATIWEKASEIMQDVYTQILTISTTVEFPQPHMKGGFLWLKSLQRTQEPLLKREAILSQKSPKYSA